MKHITSRQIALNGLIAGLYAVVTILTASFAYGNIQFRLAEALCLLVALEPTLTVGLTLGCLIANLFSTVSALDIIVGTAATLLACLLTRYIKNTWLLPLPTILCNMLMVGAMLSALYMPADKNNRSAPQTGQNGRSYEPFIHPRRAALPFYPQNGADGQASRARMIAKKRLV